MAEHNYVRDKVIVVTGAAGGFGRLVCEKTAALGAKVACRDIDAAALTASVNAPEHLAAQIVYAINQPLGVSIADITVRASGDGYVL